MKTRRIAGNIGAEISGVDLSQPLDTETTASIRQVLLDHKVVFFRGQNLGHREHVSFARKFGPLTAAHPFVNETPPGFPQILPVNHRHDQEKYGVTAAERRRTEASSYSGWHSDLTPIVNPPAICILRAEVVPEYCGDTIWTNLTTAFADISSEVQNLLSGLSAEHRYLAGYQSGSDDQDAYKAEVSSKPYAALHPVVRIHPETGERTLFVNPLFTAAIAGLSAQESRHILDMIFEQMVHPAHTVRFHWEPGSVAMWDNRATAHLAPADLNDPDLERILYRVSIVGDVPVGPDGRMSTAIAGEPWKQIDTDYRD